MLRGLLAGTMMTGLFWTKTQSSPWITPACFALSICGWSAEAKRSAFAPCSSCVSRVVDAAKLYVIAVPGLAASICCFSSLKASVSEAAAKTVKVPAMRGDVPTARGDPGVPRVLGRAAGEAPGEAAVGDAGGLPPARGVGDAA